MTYGASLAVQIQVTVCLFPTVGRMAHDGKGRQEASACLRRASQRPQASASASAEEAQKATCHFTAQAQCFGGRNASELTAQVLYDVVVYASGAAPSKKEDKQASQRRQ